MTDQDRITQLEASCAAMRSVMDNALKDPANTGHDTLSAIGKVLSSTDAGKALLDRLQKAEDEVEKWQGEFDTVRDLLHQSQDRLQAVEKEHTALRLAAEELVTYVRHGDQEDIGEAMGKIESILQPKEQK